MSNEKEIVVNASLSKAIDSATDAESIRSALHAEADSQGIRAEGDDRAAQFPATRRTRAPREAAAVEETEPFTRTETIGGRSFTFEAPTELELERMVTNAFKVATGVQQPSYVSETAETAAQAAARASQVAMDKVELELKFKRGEIPADVYLEQSGAVADYLAKQGVPLGELKATLEEGRSRGFEQSWADATQDFLQSAAGRDWPGGDRNLNIIGLKLQELNLVDAEDKVAALSQAYASMRQTGIVFPYEPPAGEEAAQPRAESRSAYARTTASAASNEPRPAAKTARTSSSMFGQSSGIGGGESRATAPQAKMFDIPANASPTEILEAYKAGLVQNGQDPNTEFTSTFAHRK